MIPIFTYQNLMSHIDGSVTPPEPEISVDGKTTANPLHSPWVNADHRTIIILHSSLTEEAVVEVLGLSTARSIWVALEAAFSNSSVERIQNLRDNLRQLVKGNDSVAVFGRRFKSLCDQLAVVGAPVALSDQFHWFLCGLGPSFETFSTSLRTSRLVPVLRDLLAQAESHELFLKSLHGTQTTPVAFSANASSNHNHESRGKGTSRYTRGGGRGRGRRKPHCQLCRTDGHYANMCPQLPQFASKAAPTETDIAKAFQAQCHVASNSPDWFVDTGATDHMTSNPANVTNTTPYPG